MNKSQKIVTCLLAVPLLFLQSCLSLYPTAKPIKTKWSHANHGSRGKGLMVLIPGRGSGPDHFFSEGFVELLHDKKPDWDCVAVNAHFGYYIKRNLLPRLHEDIVLPALKDGYEHIWIVGVSRGGLGGLLYLKEFGDDIERLILFAPFLGYDEIIAEIEESGGAKKWHAPSPLPEKDWQRGLWAWLKEYTKDPDNAPPIYLGYGSTDRFANSHRLLEELLPKEHVNTIDGGHEWPIWKQLFDKLLTSGE